jgi:hypothetical protein
MKMMTVCCRFYATLYRKMMILHPSICVVCICHSTRNLHYESLFFVRFFRFSFSLFHRTCVDNIQYCNIYAYVYLSNVFCAFSERREKNWDLLDFFLAMPRFIKRTKEKSWKWEQHTKKNIYIYTGSMFSTDPYKVFAFCVSTYSCFKTGCFLWHLFIISCLAHDVLPFCYFNQYKECIEKNIYW